MPNYTLHHGDCLHVMRAMPDASVDAVVSDPPYGLAFMGKEWDDFGWKKAGISKPGIGDRPTEWVAHGDVFGGSNPTCETCGGRKRGKKRCACVTPVWRVKGAALSSANVAAENFYEFTNAWAIEALRVAKPGAHLLAFGGTRTYHRLACAIEDAGWEVRDQIAWLYGSGFPKSHNLDGDHEGWGTALKPAMEPICVARKPLVGTVAKNVETFGTGALNIDGCRVGASGGTTKGSFPNGPSVGAYGDGLNGACDILEIGKGRWPANVVHDGSDEVLAGFPDLGRAGVAVRRNKGHSSSSSIPFARGTRDAEMREDVSIGDSGSAARFFFAAPQSPDELLFCRAKAIMAAWNGDLATTADSDSALPSEHVASALSDAATLALRAGTPSSVSMEPSTSATPTESRALCESVITAILMHESEHWRGRRLDALIPNGCRVSGAAPCDPTGTMTITTSLSRSDGSVVAATFSTTPQSRGPGEADSRSRFRYCAKASRSEREAGLREAVVERYGEQGQGPDPKQTPRVAREARNTHPTVKPVALMRWLCRLVTPPGGIVLDPFTGSGTTGVAAVQEGFRFIGIEREAQYVEIARARIDAALPKQPALL